MNRPPQHPCHRPTFGRLSRTLLLAVFCAAAELCPRAAADDWNQNADPGNSIPYLRLDELRAFYKFAPETQDRRSGARSVSNGSITLVFGPEPRALSIHGVRCQLTHPAKVNARGELLLSKADVVKLIDPVLRPTYIAQRREVKTIVIDAGHGGHDVGQQTQQIREADITLSLARQLATQLQQRGFSVLLTREDNRYLSDQQRIDRANKAENAIFLSLHLNHGRSDFHGVETYTVAPFSPAAPAPEQAAAEAPECCEAAEADAGEKAESVTVPPAPVGPKPGNEQDSANIALAFALQSSLVATTGAQDGGCRRTRYSLLSSIRCPAAIVELGYATHAEEAAALNTEEYRATLVTALANGVEAFARAIKPGAKPPVTAAPPPPPPPTPVKVDSINKGSNKADSSKKNTGKSGKTIRKSKGRSSSRSKSRRSNSTKSTKRRR